MAPSVDVTRAMILAAGEGTRLRPLTRETPKVLLTVGGVPLVYHTLAWLRRHGICDVAINLCHLADEVKDNLGDGSSLGISIIYCEEERLLGTAGGVKRMEGWFSETFAVVYGDVLTDMDLSAMIQFHADIGASATIALQEVEDAAGKGVVRTEEQGRIRSFVEKPALGAEPGCLINAGIYLLEPEILEHVEPGFSDFGTDVFPRLLDRGVRMYGWRLRPWEYLVDIGTPEAYQQANDDMGRGKVNVAPGRVP